MRDLDQIRTFLTSAGPIAIVDLPWMPVFLAICFLIHPWLGLVSLAGAGVLLAVTILTERASREPARAVAQEAGVRGAMVEADRRNSETVVAMGMAATLAARWTSVNERYLAALGRVERRGRLLWQHLQGAAAAAAVGDPRSRRLSGDPAGD